MRIPGGKHGAVAVIQRANSDLRCTPHVHAIFLDGLYGPANKRKPIRIVVDPDAHPVAKGNLCGQHAGFNLHAFLNMTQAPPPRRHACAGQDAHPCDSVGRSSPVPVVCAACTSRIVALLGPISKQSS